MTPACEDGNQKLVEVVTVVVDDEKQFITVRGWEAILREALDFGGEGAVEEESSAPQWSEPRLN